MAPSIFLPTVTLPMLNVAKDKRNKLSSPKLYMEPVYGPSISRSPSRVPKYLTLHVADQKWTGNVIPIDAVLEVSLNFVSQTVEVA